tara:strand:- start:8524 stop:8646 length:123 start_codon:yes stop_codon:yes gene_type:complete
VNKIYKSNIGYRQENDEQEKQIELGFISFKKHFLIIILDI